MNARLRDARVRTARVRIWRSGTAALAAVLAAGCANLRPETDLRAQRIEQAVVPMARAALAAGQVETARRLYTRLLDVAPDAVDARMGLGDVAFADGRPARAATWYLDAAGLAVDPARRHVALLAHGRASITAGDIEAARRSFERLVGPEERASAANAAWGHNGMAVVAMLEGDPAGTVAAVERALLLLPDEPRFRDNLARAVAIADAYRSEIETDRADHAATQLAQADSVGVPANDHVVAAPAPGPGPKGVDPGTTAVAEPAPSGRIPADDPAPAADVDRPVRMAAQDDVPPTADHAGGLPPVSDEAVASGPDRAVVDGDAPPDAAAAAEPPATGASVEAPPALAEAVAARPEAPAVPQETDRGRPEQPSAAAPDLHPAVVGFLVQGADGDYLQVGAFAVAANARSLAERLPRVTDLPVSIEPPGDQRPALYRVRVGPIPSRSGLPRLMQALRDGAATPARRSASTPDAGRKSAATS